MADYRDEAVAARARTQQLERELGDALRDVERLRGVGAPGEAGSAATSRLLGTPVRIERTAEISRELSDEELAPIASILRARLGIQAAQVGRELRGPGFVLDRGNGRTRLTLSGDWSPRPLGVVALIAMSATLLLPPCLALAWAIWPLHAVMASALALASLVAVAGLGTFVRGFAADVVRRERAAVDGTFEAILDVARGVPWPYASDARVRVAPDPEAAASRKDALGASAEQAAAEVEEPVQRAERER